MVGEVKQSSRSNLKPFPTLQGTAYDSAGFPVVGEVKQMPSGGFIYMDRSQLVGDVKSGLIDLAKKQWACVNPKP